VVRTSNIRSRARSASLACHVRNALFPNRIGCVVVARPGHGVLGGGNPCEHN
jgi:hypothetical protein